MQRAQGFAQQGAEVVWTAGVPSSTLVQGSYPFAVITVFVSGTTELAQIYSDNQQFPTPMANPFMANASGYWWFYAANGRYDVMIESPELDVPWTIGDILLNDGGGGGIVGTQTPWLSNIDGGGFNLTNVGFIDVTGGYLINGVPIGGSNLWVQVPNSSSIYHQGFVGVINQNPAFALDVQGGVNCTDNFYINGVAITAGGGGGGPWVVLGPSAINYPGHVGINNSNPQYAMDVNGSINVSTGNNFFINGVAIGSGGQNPWTILTGNRITYAGQVGIGQNPPAYPLDVLGDANVTGTYRVNGVPISAGLWIAGNANVIYYTAGNVGIGTSSPAVPLAVAGTIAATGFAMNNNPTSPVINANGAFVGAGVNVGSFGVGCGDVTATGPVSCVQTAGQPAALQANGNIWSNQIVAAAAFALYGNPSAPIINASGAFVGAGVNVLSAAGGPYGITAGTATIGPMPSGPNTTVLFVHGDIQCDESIDITGQMIANAYAIQSTGHFGGTGTYTDGTGGSIVVEQGLVISFVNGTGSGGGSTSPTFSALTVNGTSTLNGNITQSSGSVFTQGGVQCIANGIFGGNGVQTGGAVYASVFGIDGYGNAVTLQFTTLEGYVIQARGGLVQSYTTGGSAANLNVASLTASGNVSAGSYVGGLFQGSGVYTSGNVVCADCETVSTSATQWIGAGLGYQVNGFAVIDGSRNVNAATVTASQFNVAGGNPGVSAVVSWYGASSSGGPANVLHQIVIENGIVVAAS